MKTLTITISDEAARELDRAVEGSGLSAEQAASRAVEDAYAEDWLADLSKDDRAAIEEGWAQAERGEFASDAEIDEAFSRFNR